jgi:threonine synthase
VNDILARTLETGRYEKRGVTPTISPSMDIQVSSNFERLLAEVCDRDGSAVRRMMDQLAQSGSFSIEEGPLAEMRTHFGAGRCDEAQTAAKIAELWKEAGYLLDPHTAIGVHVAREYEDGSVPMVVLGTAHPAKFPDAVEKASGIRPELPDNLKDMMTAEERQQVLAAEQDVVERFIETHARAVTARV